MNSIDASNLRCQGENAKIVKSKYSSKLEKSKPMSPIVKVVQPSGMLDGAKGNELRHEISDIVTAGADIVLIDLQDVNFIDSSGLGALVAAMKTVRNIGGKLFVCSINEQVRIVFELTRMDRIFQNFADRDEFNRQVVATY